MKTKATMRGAAGAAAEITDAQATRTLAVFAGVAALAGPRQTRPLAGFLYGLLLSRAHGAGVNRIGAMLRAGSEKAERWHAEHRRRLDNLEQAVETIARDLDITVDPAMDSGAAG